MDDLPTWDLRDIYKSRSDVDKDLKILDKMSLEFVEKFENKVSQNFPESIVEYEKFESLAGKIGSYAFLLHVTDTQNSELSVFKQNVTETLNEYSSRLVFYALEINQIDDLEIDRMIEGNKVLQFYKQWIKETRSFKPYQLSKDVEKILNEKSSTSGSAWVRLFDETIGSIGFDFDGKMLNAAEILNLTRSENREIRKKASKSLGKGLKNEIKLFSLIMNIIVKGKAIEDNARGFDRPISSRNLENVIEDEVTDALIETVKSNYKNLSHRYYKLKAKWLGLDKLEYWDRNAPLPFSDNEKITYKKAKEIVINAYSEFSGEAAEIVKMFFENDWIDAKPKAGKDSGAFCSEVSPELHPYILINYQGKINDVMTLAHELGHGVHMFLSRKQGALMADTPLTLAETASIFGEQLTFKFLLKNAQNDEQRKHMIASKIEGILNSVIRQVAFSEFETAVHDKRKNGELLPEEIGQIWMSKQKESLGDAFNFSEEYESFWSYIPHFIHVPFYVYAYAFGNCLVNSMYRNYEQSDNKELFKQKYLNMLSSGGSKAHKELLAPFGIDISKNDFWQSGLDIVDDLITQLEEMN